VLKQIPEKLEAQIIFTDENALKKQPRSLPTD